MASAGRLCYAPVSAAELKSAMDDDDVRRLVRGLVRSGPPERVGARQLHLSRSTAYPGPARISSCGTALLPTASSLSATCVLAPTGVSSCRLASTSSPEARAVFYEAMDNARRSYERLVELGLAEGRSNESVFEDARFVSAQRGRDQDRRDHECPRAAGTSSRSAVAAGRSGRSTGWPGPCVIWRSRSAPLLFEGTGPGCMTGGCPEGKMSCGEPYSEEEILSLGLLRSVTDLDRE